MVRFHTRPDYFVRGFFFFFFKFFISIFVFLFFDMFSFVSAAAQTLSYLGD